MRAARRATIAVAVLAAATACTSSASAPRANQAARSASGRTSTNTAASPGNASSPVTSAPPVPDPADLQSAFETTVAVAVRGVVSLDGKPSGVDVVQVTPGGAADKAGIHAGDVITAIGTTQTPSTADLSTALAQHKADDTVPVTVLHSDGATATVTVTLDAPK